MKRYVNLDEILLALPKSAAKIIEGWPLADVAPVRHGRWKLKHWAEERDNRLIDNYECSMCHNWAGDATDFCPNCGADMREVESEK